MLILTRRAGESVVIGDGIEITILGINGGKVRVGVRAPLGVPVHRKEVAERLERMATDGGSSAASDDGKLDPAN